MYKKIRFYLRFLSALVAKYYLGIGLGLVLGVLSFYFLPGFLDRIPKVKTVKHVAYVGRFTLSELPLPIQQKLSIGLTSISDKGFTSPAIASRWEATDSGKTYIFTVNRDLKWQDGTKIKSKDIQYRFSDATVEYPDDDHIIIKLQDPFSPLPSVVSRPVFKNPTSPKYIGAGSYKIKSSRRNGTILESITLTPVAKDTQLPDLKYYFYPSFDQARTALKLSLIDSIEDLPDPQDLTQWPNLTTTPRVMYDRYVAVFYNTEHPNLTGQPGRNLRLALSYAIDKNRWPNRAYGPISPTSWAYNDSLKKYDFDQNRAKELLKGVDKVPEEMTLSAVPAYLSVAESIKSDWEALGIKVNIQVTPEIPDEFEALVVAQAIPLDPDQYNNWHSTQEKNNITRFKNARIDKLLEDGRKTFDLKERQKLYQDFQRFLVDEAPAVFLFYPQTFSVDKK